MSLNWECAKLYFAGLPTLWQRKRNKVGCQQESQVKAPGGGEKFFLLVKVGTAFVFVLFVILILRRRNWAKTGLKLQGNVINKVVRHWRVYGSRPKPAYGRQGLGWDPQARILTPFDPKKKWCHWRGAPTDLLDVYIKKLSYNTPLQWKSNKSMAL